MKIVNIGNTLIGHGEPVYVIAEIGSNHDGDLDQAKRLIHVAADAGADAAKFQLYRADKLYPGTITPGALPDQWLPLLKTACHEAGIEFLCSIFCAETLAAYLEVQPAAIKIASPEATNLDLLADAARTGLPLIISTGATTWDDLEQLEDTLSDHALDPLGFADHVLLHCVSAYPADPAQLNLRAIAEMAETYYVPVGFSDHTLRTEPAVAAVAAGACMIEKHLTLDRNLEGPDHPFALEPDEFADMIDSIRQVEQMLGDGNKRVMPSEDPTDRRER
jgi:N,N'-diacetyllegionaminate synthase